MGAKKDGGALEQYDRTGTLEPDVERTVLASVCCHDERSSLSSPPTPDAIHPQHQLPVSGSISGLGVVNTLGELHR